MKNQLLSTWCRLMRSPSIGALQIFRLQAQGELEAFLREGKNQSLLGLSPHQRKQYEKVDSADIERDLAWISHENHHFISCVSEDYPYLLKQIPDPPIGLFAIGDTSLLKQPQLAIVGSRTPSVMGKETAFSFARTLASAGMTITSGLALGIDGAAHEGALSVQGKTIAVCGTGLDKIYPDKHRTLGKKICEQGLVISEFPLGIPPKPQHFPQRNRIISGLSLGVLVVEAALQSGSLITARTASEQGREVFAIPGSIHNPLVKGCHSLIRQGAKLVESVEDILEEFGAFAGLSSFKEEPEKTDAIISLDEAHQNLLDNIGHETTSIDVLVLRTGLETSTIGAMLLNLELEGFIKSVLGGVVKCS